MKDDLELKLFPIQHQQPKQESQQTDYGEDPHVYGNIWQYIMTAMGVCVGFGAFWRFPYLVYRNGGGVFLIPYIFSLVLIGVPLLYFETGIGQMFRLTTPFVFKKLHPCLKIVGIGIMTATFHFAASFNILLTYCYRFMLTAFMDPLPFAKESITDLKYFHENVLHKSEGISHFEAIDPLLLGLFVFSLVLCHYVIKDGAKTSGKIAIITASTPFVFLFILVVRGLFLEGAFEGIAYLFNPKWDQLWNYKIWVDATTQVFYQLNTGIGTMINLSSSKPKRQDLLKSVFIVPFGLFLCGILSALTIFIYLSHFCLLSGFSIDDPRLELSGIQLSFNVLPKALMMLPLPNLWIFIFFAAMVLLGIDSEFGLMESLYGCVRDQFKTQTQTITLLGVNINARKGQYLMLLILCVGAPTLTSHAGIFYLQFYDYFMSNIPFTLWVLVQLYFFVYVFPLEELTNAIHRYTKVPTPPIITYCLKSYWLPGLLLTNLFFATYNQLFIFHKYSLGFYVFGWIFTLYPVFLIYYVLRRQWPGWNNLKLTFAKIDEHSS